MTPIFINHIKSGHFLVVITFVFHDTLHHYRSKWTDEEKPKAYHLYLDKLESNNE